ncbi:MAG: hypothetical protein GC166_07975 [Alphaproteobacteria bacterium]|nr:hypothetical protein [Alphaproteobacteria bacterium]
MTRYPVIRTVWQTLHFVARRAPAIVGAVAIPFVAGWIVLYWSLGEFLDQLGQAAEVPGDRVRTLALGIMAAGLVLAIFIKCIAVLAVTEIAGEEAPRFKLRFRIDRSQWRLFAANLRLSVLLLFLIFLERIYAGWLDQMHFVNFYAGLSKLLMSVFFVYLILVLGFFMPPVVVHERGAIVRRSVNLFRNSPGAIFAIVLLLLVPGWLADVVTELGMSMLGVLPVMSVKGPLAERMDDVRNILPQFLTAALAAYTVSMTLMTVAATRLYRQHLTDSR